MFIDEILGKHKRDNNSSQSDYIDKLVLAYVLNPSSIRYTTMFQANRMLLC